MLLFGPKSVHANQTQYMGSVSGQDQTSQGFVVCNITDFTGIPFADTFAIVSFWFIGNDSNGV
jgi:hypothetical protein